MSPIRHYSINVKRHQLRGITLIELLVALTISLFIAIAAGAALLASRQGFTSVDAESQLRDNERFITDLLQRLGVQTGYRDIVYAASATPASTSGLDDNPPPNVFGLNNSSRTANSTWDAGTTRTSGTTGYGSDILVLRYQTGSATTASTVSDQGIIDCSGVAPTAIATDRSDRIISILHIGISGDGEPSLMCSRSDTGLAPYQPQPLVRGVENLQVLYGVDGVAPGNTTVPITSTPDTVPERYVRADQLTISGNDAATYANWRRVRSIRIGMVLRGPVGSAVDRTSQTFYPFGAAQGSTSGATGSAFSSTNDAGTTFTPAVDGRLRRAMTFTVHLRNPQEDR